MGTSTLKGARRERTVRPEVREVLLGPPSAERSCGACGSVNPVPRWPVAVTYDDDRVAYCGQCPACESTDRHVIVDPADRW